jgi:hypothetical protein
VTLHRTALDRASTVRRRHLISGQAEHWNARSADGRFDYERQEGPGTPWRVTDRTTGSYFLAASLPNARAITADPAAVESALRRAPAARCGFVSTAGGCRQRCPEPPAPGHDFCTRHGGIR